MGYQSFASVFRAAETGEPSALDRLADVAADMTQPAIVRASALARLAGSGQFTRDFAQRMAADASPLVRMATVQLADVMPAETRAAVLGPLLGDATRAVRIEAARSLAGGQDRLPQELLPRWEAASQEYVATLQYNADRPESRVALGGFRAALGQADAAHAQFTAAIQLDPEFVPAYVNAADVLRTQGRDQESAEILQQGLQRVPMSATLHHALGLARIRLQQPELAMGSLRRAVELDPATARYSYVYAVALHSTGQVDGIDPPPAGGRPALALRSRNADGADVVPARVGEAPGCAGDGTQARGRLSDRPAGSRAGGPGPRRAAALINSKRCHRGSRLAASPPSRCRAA